MPFGQTFQRLSVLLEPEVARLQDRHAMRVSGYDSVRYVASERAVVYLRGGASVWIARAELLARLPPGLGLLRWWWYGMGIRGSGKSRLDAILAEGQQHGVREFITESIVVDDDAAAETLCKVAAFIARADGLLRIEDAQGASFLALFDAPGARLTPPDAPPPSRAISTEGSSLRPFPPETPKARPAARPEVPARRDSSPGESQSLTFTSPPPPSSSTLRAAAPLGGMDTDEPFETVEASTSIRGSAIRGSSAPPSEPPRELLLPVAQRAMAEISQALGAGFQKAMMVVSVGVREGKARFSVSLVSVDLSGELQAHDASRELCTAVGDLISQHAKLPGGRWRRLVTRFRSTPRGASVDVSVDA